MKLDPILDKSFPGEFSKLAAADRSLLMTDFKLLLADEYDVPDPTMGDGIENENIEEAASEYRRRIGRNNLASYCKVLAAGVKSR